MFENAKWIDCPEGAQAPIFRKEFSAVKGEEAEIIICGLGFFELKINGKRVSDDLLVPNASNYGYRDMDNWNYPIYDKLSFRTYCVKYDLTSYLESENALTVMLGGGYYHQSFYKGEGDVNYGSPKLCFIIKKKSGNVISDSSVDCFKGFFERCNLYYGEIQDYTKKPLGYEFTGYEGKDFAPSREIDAPETDFYMQIGPADKVTDTITDIKLLEEKDGVKLYDIGKNIAGRAVIKCDKPGEKIKVRYAEQIKGHNNWGIHFSSERYSDTFITDGKQKEYTTLFGWQGFRFVEITGDCEILRAEIIHSDIPVTSSFECDNENLNWLYDTYIHTQLCNMHSGVPSDCPHRERLGYTGDGQLCAEAAMLMLDSKSFYRKWLYDIADCQCKESGHVEHTAPFMGGGGGPCGWGGAIVEVPLKYYLIYGDRSVLEEFFPKMLHFLEYLNNRSENGLVCREEEGGWCLGDWLPPERIRVPETYVNTCLYIRFMKQVMEIAAIIGREDEVKHLPERIALSSKMVNAAYYSDQQAGYCGDVDGASCLAMQAGIGNDKVKNQIIKKYKSRGMFDTGIIATLELTEYLYSIGENDLATTLLSNNREVSFGYMKANGATTLWENWNGDSSQNHPMFGAVARCLFTKLLGIGQKEGTCAFESVVITPHFTSLIKKAKGEISTVKGKISVEYEITDEKTRVKVYAEPGINAEFIYGDIKEKFSGEKVFEF